MDIMFVASEATPYAKTGGLADVIGSLPSALARLGHRVSLVLPMHSAVKNRLEQPVDTVATYDVVVDARKAPVTLWKTANGDIHVYLLENPDYFSEREQLYGYYDDGERYGFFNTAVAEMFEHIGLFPDIVHLNDWHSALIPLMLRARAQKDSRYQAVKTVLTIHNLAYQGHFPRSLLPCLNVPAVDALFHEGDINFLKAGIETADFITTVSRSYAKEILEEPLGCGLSKVLKKRRMRLTGIMNGLDYIIFDPQNDAHLIANYDIGNVHRHKPKNKERLLKMFHMETEDVPLIGMVSRIDEAKGFPILEPALDRYLREKRLQFVLLGSGDKTIEARFQQLKRKHASGLGLYFGYSDSIAHAVYAGADFFMMPSRYEPCGLAQLIAMRYGTPPVVHGTGGLKDSVSDADAENGTGFVFPTYDEDALNETLERVLSTYRKQAVMRRLMERAMATRFDWRKSAKAYADLYSKLMEE